MAYIYYTQGIKLEASIHWTDSFINDTINIHLYYIPNINAFIYSPIFVLFDTTAVYILIISAKKFTESNIEMIFIIPTIIAKSRVN